MVPSEVERSLGVLPALHRPEGAKERLGNLQPVTRTLPPPGFPLSPTLQRGKKKNKNPNAAFSVMKHQPPEQLLGSCEPQTPACDRERDSGTQDRVFSPPCHMGPLAWLPAHQSQAPLVPCAGGLRWEGGGLRWEGLRGEGGKERGAGGCVCLSWMLCALTQGGKGGGVSGYVCAMRWPLKIPAPQATALFGNPPGSAGSREKPWT